MFRILFSVGPAHIYSYGFMLALAFVIGTLIARKRAGLYGMDKDKVTDLVFYLLVSGVAGSRLLFVAVNWEYYSGNLLDIFKVWEGGLVFYGGFILAFIVTAVFLRVNRLPLWKTADMISPSFAIGIALGRIGCFLNGCCYGHVSQRWGISFPAKDNPPVFAQQISEGLIPASASCSLPVIPVQLYAVLHGIIIFAVLMVMEKHKKFDGFLFWIMVLLYGAGRFFIESARYYDRNFMLGSASLSQAISVVLFIVSAAVLAARSLKCSK